MSTYRAYQEAADRSLTRLISADLPLPTATSDVTRLLQLRHVCLGVLVERLEHIARASGLEASRARLLTKVSADPVSALGHTLRGMAPETPADFSIMEVTDRSGAAATQVIDEYREVARNLILANHNLTHAAEQPWLTNRVDAWPIVTDLATNTEAMLEAARACAGRPVRNGLVLRAGLVRRCWRRI